ncbi:MAG: alkane 1-monooxygenase [Alphaproteobacteria bacterium]|nr:alkane 1-monooxygenase [Alphaproteobacteria bacterium]MBV9692672.1 alkane 1-monooxygenase [Alphaproteobacteria bacterium]
MILYATPFLLLGSVWAFRILLGAAGPLLSVVLLLAILLGAEFVAPRAAPPALEADRNFRTLFYIYVPLQLASIAAGMWLAAKLGPLGLLSLAFSLGIMTGVFGMLAAHELVHSRLSGERALGTVMLSGMLYRHFRIAHIHIHHRYVATEKDSATARLGEGFYGYLLRTLPGQFLEAWRIERLRRAMWQNRVLWDLAIALVILSAALILTGVKGAVFFMVQAFVAIAVLELFNYVAHYGLSRRVDARGHIEPLADRHSWNSSNLLVNFVIFNMGRHSHHHSRPSISYQGLEYKPSAPELPAGYAGSILLALAPPLWRRVMDRRVQRFEIAAAPAMLAAE